MEVISVVSPFSKYVVLKVKAQHVQDVKPGQYCMVNIAVASYFQWHPISICSYNKDSHEVTFIIKNVGDWTADICNAVNSSSSDEVMQNFKVRLYGPFGKLRFNLGADLNNVYYYEKIILVAGGIGCTPIISTLNWLIDNASQEKNRLHVTVLLTARDREMFSLFGHFFKRFNDRDVFQKGGIDLRLYCTANHQSKEVSSGAQNSLEIRLISESRPVLGEENLIRDDFMGAVTNVTVPIVYSRPDIEKEIATVCECREVEGGRVCVLVCGPEGIVTAVQRGCSAAVSKFGPVLDLHEESFRL